MNEVMGEILIGLLELGFGIWNSIMSFLISMIATPPQEFKDGAVWDIIMTVEPIFIALGSSLVAVFYLIGFCEDSMTTRETMRFENIILTLVRLFVSEALVVYNVEILQAIFASAGNLIQLLGTQEAAQLTLTESHKEIILSMNFVSAIVVAALFIIMFVFMLVMSFMMLYTLFFRFLHIFLLVPYGAIAFATFAGTSKMRDIMHSYIKYLFTVVLEGVTIMLTIMVCNAFNAGGLGITLESFHIALPIITVFADVIIMACTTGITVAGIKSARDVTGHILGLRP